MLALVTLQPGPFSLSFNGTGQHPMIVWVFISTSCFLTQERAFNGINLVAPKTVKEEGSLPHMQSGDSHLGDTTWKWV